jgi:hypothetical protein
VLGRVRVDVEGSAHHGSQAEDWQRHKHRHQRHLLDVHAPAYRRARERSFVSFVVVLLSMVILVLFMCEGPSRGWQ